MNRGVPKVVVWYRGRSITIELKSRRGKCSASQRIARAEGCCVQVSIGGSRSARAAMWALRKLGVRFRAIVYEDGGTERWRQPRLAPWEVPRRNPAEPRPNAPNVKALRASARKRARLRQRRARAIL
jgi:hypothetical protein